MSRNLGTLVGPEASSRPFPVAILGVAHVAALIRWSQMPEDFQAEGTHCWWLYHSTGWRAVPLLQIH